MKKFERFIIYPMLFIALFFSFAGDEVKQITAQQVYDEIIAKSIKVVNDKGNTLIEISAKGNEYKDYGQINIATKYTDTSSKLNTKIEGGNISIENGANKTFIGTSSISLSDKNNKLYLGNNFRIIEDDFFDEDDDEDDDIAFGFGIDMYSKEDEDDETKIGKNSSFILTNGANGSSISLFNKEGDYLIHLGSNKENHGLINIYDKYGEDWRSYTYE